MLDSVIGNLVCKITADGSQFAREVQSTTALVDKLSGKAVSLGVKMAAAGTAMIAPLGLAVREFTNYGSELADISAQTGVAASSLSVFKYAAEQTGSSLGAVSGAVSKMQRNIANAADGNKAAVKGLNDLGLSAEDLAGLAPEKQFAIIAGELNKIEDQGQKTAATMAVFGRGGVGIKGMIGDFDNLTARADRLGIAISDEAAAAADEFGDKLYDLSALLKRIGFEIGGQIIGSLTGLIDKMILSRQTILEFIKVHPALTRNVAALSVGLTGGGVALVIFGKFARELAGPLRILTNVIGGVSKAVSGLVVKLATTAAMFIAPWLPAIAVIAAVAAAVGGLAYWIMGPEGIATAWGSVASGAASAFTLARGFVYNFQENIGKLGSYLAAVFSKVWENLGTGLGVFIKSSLHNFGVLIGAVFRVGAVLMGVIGRTLIELPGMIAGAVKAIVPWLLETGMAAIKSLWKMVWDVLGAVKDTLIALGTGAVQFVWGIITGVFNGLWDFVKGYGNLFVEFWSMTWESIWTLDFLGWAQKGIKMVWDKFWAFASGLKDLIVKVFTFDFTMPESMKTLFDDFEAGATSGEDAMKRIKQIAAETKDSLKDPLGGFGLDGISGPNFNFTMPEAPKIEMNGSDFKMPEIALDEKSSELIGSIGELKNEERDPRKLEEKKTKKSEAKDVSKYTAVEAGSVEAYKADVMSRNSGNAMAVKQLEETKNTRKATEQTAAWAKRQVEILRAMGQTVPLATLNLANG